MIERQIEVTTPEGEMTTFVFHPEHADRTRSCST